MPEREPHVSSALDATVRFNRRKFLIGAGLMGLAAAAQTAERIEPVADFAADLTDPQKIRQHVPEPLRPVALKIAELRNPDIGLERIRQISGIQTIAHNAYESKNKWERALKSRIPYVEVDITSDGFGELFVAHGKGELAARMRSREGVLQHRLLDYTEQVAESPGKTLAVDLKMHSSEDDIGDSIYGVVDMLQQMPETENPIIVAGRDMKVVNAVRNLVDGVNVLPVYSVSSAASFAHLHDAIENDTDMSGWGVALNKDLADQYRMDYFNEREVPVVVWTVENRREIARYASRGAFAITGENYDDLSEVGRSV